MGRIPEGPSDEGGYLSPSIGYLWPHHKTMARMLIAGQQPGDIAAIMGFSKGQVSRIIGSPTFQSELLRLQEDAEGIAVDVLETIRKMVPVALEVIDKNMRIETFSDSDKRLQQSAAFGLLDIGVGKKETHINKNLNVNTTMKDIKEMTTDDLRDDIADMLEVD